MKKLGNNHDEPVINWRKELESKVNPENYQIIGDNLDCESKARTCTREHQNQSNHWFNLMAMKDAVSGQHLSDYHQRKMSDVGLHEFFTSSEDMNHIRENFVVLISRMIVKRVPNLYPLRKCVNYHIKHQYSEVMAQKTEEV